ncbi:MAG: restriction endonuclease subunit S [Deltaproteobacteria bacterium]
MTEQLLTENKTFLRFVDFAEINLWDVKRYKLGKIKSDFPIVSLAQHINEETEKLRPQDFPNQKFKILGVNNKTGIFDAYEQATSVINQSYKKMDIGFIAYNPYRVNVGSIGMRTNEHKNDLISPAYVVFSCDNELNPDFLFKLFKTDKYNQIIKDKTTGSVRQNLTFDILKTIKIPLPKIDEQVTILNKFYHKIELAEKWKEKAYKLECYIDDYLLEILDIQLPDNNIEKGKLTTASFNNLNRWSVDFLANQELLQCLKHGKYKAEKIENYIKEIQYGTSSKANTILKGLPILRMNNIVNSEIDYSDMKHIVLSKKDEQSLILDYNDLLFNRTNSKELVGKTAVYKKQNEKYTFASYLIRVKLDTQRINVDFVNFLFNSKIGRFQIDMTSRQITGQANVNSEEMKSFIFPIPDIEIQNRISEKILKIRAIINKLTQSSESFRLKAINDFEKSVVK